MLTFDSALQTILNGCTSKSNWSSQLKAALGNTRRLRGLKDGVEFLNVGLIGSMTVSNGAISNFGIAKGVTTQTAVDLSTGTCVLRIEGNGHWAQGTVGLPGSGADFIVPSNPTATCGWGFQSTTQFLPKQSLPATTAPDILDLVVYFGPQGNATAVHIAASLYTGMSVGHGAVTQSRWRADPVTVNGIEFTLYPGVDSDGRADCWIYATHGTALLGDADKSINRQIANVELRIDYQGAEQNMFGEGNAYQYSHQRGTWMRWQSAAMPWLTAHADIQALIDSGAVFAHDSRNVFGTLENQSTTDLYSNVVYKPFKQFGALNYTNYIGDQMRGSPTGGERQTIGPVHEAFARFISEVGTNNNAAWLTADKLNTLQATAESIAQYPLMAVRDSNHQLIDPVGYSCHRNPNAWFAYTGIPQPMQLHDATAGQDAEWDTAHHPNKVSYHAYLLSKDPYHLLMTQGAGIASVMYGTATKRDLGPQPRKVVEEEERGNWWALQTVLHAWKATPDGTLPAPFRPKLFFEDIVNNSLQEVRDVYINQSRPILTAIQNKVVSFWRTIAPFSDLPNTGDLSYSPFMCDYGAIVLAQSLLFGFTNALDVVQWRVGNIKIRALAGGNWCQEDRIQPTIAVTVAHTSDTDLPYTDTASWQAWYPYPGSYNSSNTIDISELTPRDTYMFIGVLRLYQGLVNKGLITLDFNPGAQAAAIAARWPGPYTLNGLPVNNPMWAKQYFTY